MCEGRFWVCCGPTTHLFCALRWAWKGGLELATVEEATEIEDGSEPRSQRARQYLQPEVGLPWTVRGMLQAAEPP